MNLFVIGDVHGCYYTFKKLLEQWNSAEELLVQVGDLIDRGSFSPEVVEYCKELKKKHHKKVVFLKGNHEFEMVEDFYRGPKHNWRRQCGEETLRQYKERGFNPKEHVEWFSELPLYWENENLFISHAGVATLEDSAFDENSEISVIWNRDQLENIGKLQIIGHTPCENREPIYYGKANSWNLDTGAGYGGNLTALRVSEYGEVLEMITLKTLCEDNLKGGLNNER